MNPKISIVMPVYNAEKFLKYSIESILNQTENGFEFIIINDGSKDNSLNIIHDYAKKDERIKILDQKNTGIVGALNNALKICSGVYIARMDADDISLPNRLEKQINILEKENAFICGTWANIIDEENIKINKNFYYPPNSWQKIKLYLVRGNPFIHPSIMFKREVYEKEKDIYGNLYKSYKNIEDYELWTRIVPKYKSVNISEYLLNYRIHKNQITKKKNWSMRIKGIKIRLLAITRLVQNIY